MLADDLLLQARHLANLDPGKPKQVNLRRAISSAYYALFHLLSAECSKRLSPVSPRGLSSRIGRSLTHSEMKQVCKSISTANLSEILLTLIPSGFSTPLRELAGTFVMAQGERHLADYDPVITYTRVATIDLIDQVEAAFRVWRTVRATEEANVFLAALLFGSRWNK